MLQNVEIESGTLYTIKKSIWSSSILHQLAFCEIGNFCKKESTFSDNGHCAEIIGILYRHILYHYLYSTADSCRKPSLDEMFDDVTRIISLYPLIHPEKIYTTLGTAIILHCISDDIRFSYLQFTVCLLKPHHASLMLDENITPANILIILLCFEWILDTI